MAFAGYNQRMRANIIIHSVSGNLYLIANAFREQFTAMGIDARIYAVSDSDLHIEANERTEVNEYYEDIIALPEATNAKLEKADAIILATPSRFGMPTAEMKAFLDKTWPLYRSEALKGRKFYAIASSPVSIEDGEKAAMCLYAWSNMRGLVNAPYTPYVHKEGELMPNRPSEDIDSIARELGLILLAL